MATVRLYEALLGAPLVEAPEWEQTARTYSWRSPDTVEGILHGINGIREQLRPRATQFALFDEDGACSFNGFITRVVRTPGTNTAVVQAASWRAWPSHVHATGDTAWVLTDPAYIAAACWCASAAPLLTAPTGFTYVPTATDMLYGTPAQGDEPAVPVRAAWYLETNLGALLADINRSAGLIETEEHRPDYRRTPFTTVTATWRPEPPDHGAVFRIGENIVEAPGIEWGPEQFATEHLLIGDGEGPARAHAMATLDLPSTPRSTALHKDETKFRTSDQLEDEAPSAAQAAVQSLPFSHLDVLSEHSYAPRGSYEPGSLVTVDLWEEGVYTNLLVTSVAEKAENDPNVTLQLEQWGGW